MTVAELIAKLQEMPQEAPVARWENEGITYLVDVQPPEVVRVSLGRSEGDYVQSYSTDRPGDINVIAIW